MAASLGKIEKLRPPSRVDSVRSPRLDIRVFCHSSIAHDSGKQQLVGNFARPQRAQLGLDCGCLEEAVDRGGCLLNQQRGGCEESFAEEDGEVPRKVREGEGEELEEDR